MYNGGPPLDSNNTQQTRPAKTEPKECLMPCFWRKAFWISTMMPALVSPAALIENNMTCEACHCRDHLVKKGREALASNKKTTLFALASDET